MLVTPHAATQFYRVTGPAKWADLLTGTGSYFSTGGRYNRPQQRTVYASEDPLVAITEAAYYQSIKWQIQIGGGRFPGQPLPPPNLPLISSHVLWSFTLKAPPQVVDLDAVAAYQTFQHRVAWLLNPFQAYRNTNDLADAIRVHPVPAHPIAAGLIAPSARTPSPQPGAPRPSQHVFFVPPKRTRLAGKLVHRWTLVLEFKDPNQQSVTQHTPVVDWSRPSFRLSPIPTNAVAAAATRPAAPAFQPGIWHPIIVTHT